MRAKGILLVILFVVIAARAFAQQDAQFTQYMFNGLYINPAYAGYKEQFNAHMSTRSQWGDVEGHPVTSSIAVDGIANNGNVGLALMVLTDKVGAEETFSTYVNYAYRLKVGATGRLALGLGVGISQYSIDGSELDPNNPDPSVPTDKQSTIVPDIRAGVFYTTDRWYAGFSADNLISKYMNYADDPYNPIPVKNPHLYLTAGYLYPISSFVSLKPSFLIKSELGGAATMDINSFVLLGEKVWVGASYRMALNNGKLQEELQASNAFAFMTEIYVTTRLRLGYSYDFALNDLSNYNYGAHEISLGYSFIPKKIKMLTPRYF